VCVSVCVFVQLCGIRLKWKVMRDCHRGCHGVCIFLWTAEVFGEGAEMEWGVSGVVLWECIFICGVDEGLGLYIGATVGMRVSWIRMVLWDEGLGLGRASHRVMSNG